MDEKKYPVLYYDMNNVDRETLLKLSDQLGKYFDRENVPFILLPKDVMELKWLSKEEALDLLNKIVEEVKSWE